MAMADAIHAPQLAIFAGPPQGSWSRPRCVVYRVDDTSVYALHIFHTAQDWQFQIAQKILIRKIHATPIPPRGIHVAFARSSPPTLVARVSCSAAFAASDSGRGAAGLCRPLVRHRGLSSTGLRRCRPAHRDISNPRKYPGHVQSRRRKARLLERPAGGPTSSKPAQEEHEIGLSLEACSVEPTPAVYLDALGWDDGVAEFDRRERPGFDDVRRIFGVAPSCYGQPGSSWAPQTLGAMKKWGMKIYLDAGRHVGLDGKPFYYCGLLNIYQITNMPRTGLKAPGELEEAEGKFADARKELQSEGGGLISIIYHPCEFAHKEFWDGVNFRQARANDRPAINGNCLPPKRPKKPVSPSISGKTTFASCAISTTFGSSPPAMPSGCMPTEPSSKLGRPRT